MKHKLTYHQAYEALETIVQQMENSSIQLDALSEKVKEADELIRFCENKLRGIETSVKAVTEKSE